MPVGTHSERTHRWSHSNPRTLARLSICLSYPERIFPPSTMLHRVTSPSFLPCSTWASSCLTPDAEVGGGRGECSVRVMRQADIDAATRAKKSWVSTDRPSIPSTICIYIVLSRPSPSRWRSGDIQRNLSGLCRSRMSWPVCSQAVLMCCIRLRTAPLYASLYERKCTLVRLRQGHAAMRDDCPRIAAVKSCIRIGTVAHQSKRYKVNNTIRKRRPRP